MEKIIYSCSWCGSYDVALLTDGLYVCKACGLLHNTNNGVCTILSRHKAMYLLKHPKAAKLYKNMGMPTVKRKSCKYRVADIKGKYFILSRDVPIKLKSDLLPDGSGCGYVTHKEKVSSNLLIPNGITQVGQKVKYINIIRVNKETGIVENVEYYKPEE